MTKAIIVDQTVLKKLSSEAKKSKRKRLNYNFHTSSSDTIQRMLNAIEPETYIAPHKHENPDKREVFVLLKGKMTILFFDDKGEITNFISLDKSGITLVEIPPKTWHTVISMQTGTVYYEIKDGPYDVQADKIFAPWAPLEEDCNSMEFLKKLKIKSLKLINPSDI